MQHAWYNMLTYGQDADIWSKCGIHLLTHWQFESWLVDHHSILTSEDSCNGKLGTFMSVDYSCILREYRLITPNGEYFCKWKINKQLTLPAKHCSKCPRVSQDEVFAEQIGEMLSSAVSKLVNRKDQLGEKGPFKQYPIKPNGYSYGYKSQRLG